VRPGRRTFDRDQLAQILKEVRTGGEDQAPIEPSNNAERADEDSVDGLDADALELGSFCRNGVYPDAAAATGWQALAVAPRRSVHAEIIPQPRDYIDVLTPRHGLVAADFFLLRRRRATRLNVGPEPGARG
jgi:hypothetical protein